MSCAAWADLTEISRIYHAQPDLTGFDVCQGGGCVQVDRVQLTPAEWQVIQRLFTPLPEHAEQERAQLALAIGAIEDMVGTKVGTTADRAGTFGNRDYLHQQDCNDEAINTTTYLRLLQQQGLMRMHEILDMRTRHFFFTGWPHSTAVIRALDSQQVYAVDSWFYDNGEPATIVPMALWKSGYVPTDSPLSQLH